MTIQDTTTSAGPVTAAVPEVAASGAVRIDHLIVLVGDLEPWSAAFADAGFRVSKRLDQNGPEIAHRLICFENGSYLELIQVEPGDSHAPDWVERMLPLGDGFGAFSLNVPDVDATFAMLPGAAGRGVFEGGNTVVDEGSWTMRVASPAMPDGLTIPFLLQDLSGGEFRVPSGVARSHPNGARELSGIVFAVAETSSFEQQLTAVLGSPARVSGPQWADGNGACFTLPSGQWVAAFVPAAGTDVAVTLQARGAGPVEAVVTCRAGDADADGAVVAGLLPVRIRVR